MPAPAVDRPREWLYPNHGGGWRLCHTDGSAVARSEPAWRAAALAGRLVHGSGPLEAGFLSLRTGDVLWLYESDERGVIGRAVVELVAGRPAPHIEFLVDRAATRVLALDPVPGSLVRRQLGTRIDVPIRLDPRAVVTEGLHWWLDHLGDRDAQRLAPFDVTPLRAASAQQRGLLCASPIAATARALRAHDFALGFPQGRLRIADLVGHDGETMVGVRVLDAGRGAFPRTALEAIGPLDWSTWSLAHGVDPPLAVHCWLVCRGRPSGDLVRFMEDHGHSLAWSDDGRVEAGPRTRLRWFATAAAEDVRRGA